MVCDNFEKAIEEETIKLIDMYDNRDYNVVTVVKGYYIIDQYKDGELAYILAAQKMAAGDFS